MAATVGRTVHYFSGARERRFAGEFFLAFVGAVGPAGACTLMVCEPMGAPRWVEGVPEGGPAGEPGTWRFPPRD